MEEDGNRYEVIQGELFMAPSPNRIHQVISRNLCRLLYPFLDSTNLGSAYNAPMDVYLDDSNVVQPDIIVVLKGSAAKEIPEGIEGAPDLVMEILSPGTSRRDLQDKRELYTKFGAIEYWIVSPEARQIQVYRLKEDPLHPVAIYQEMDTVETPLLPGLTIPGTEVFKDV